MALICKSFSCGLNFLAFMGEQNCQTLNNFLQVDLTPSKVFVSEGT